MACKIRLWIQKMGLICQKAKLDNIKLDNDWGSNGDGVREAYFLKRGNFLLEVSSSENRQVSSLVTYSAELYRIEGDDPVTLLSISEVHRGRRSWHDIADFACDLFKETKKRFEGKGLKNPPNPACAARYDDLHEQIQSRRSGGKSRFEQEESWQKTVSRIGS